MSKCAQVGLRYSPDVALPAPRRLTTPIDAPVRWRDWVAPGGTKRAELTDGAMGAFLGFVNGELLPYLQAQTRFAYKTSATQVLFLQHVIGALKAGGRCGLVIDEGVLFRTTEAAFVSAKRKLLDDCDLSCILSLPPGACSRPPARA